MFIINLIVIRILITDAIAYVLIAYAATYVIRILATYVITYVLITYVAGVLTTYVIRIPIAYVRKYGLLKSYAYGVVGILIAGIPITNGIATLLWATMINRYISMSFKYKN